MTLTEDQACLTAVQYSKRLPTAFYLHREGLLGTAPELGRFVSHLADLYQIGPEFNVLKRCEPDQHRALGRMGDSRPGRTMSFNDVDAEINDDGVMTEAFSSLGGNAYDRTDDRFRGTPALAASGSCAS